MTELHREEADEAARKALSAWGIPVKPVFLQKAENFAYTVESSRGKMLLRVTHESHRTPELVAAELDWIDHLSRHSVPVVAPVPAADGALFTTVVSGSGSFIATLFPFVDGRTLNFARNPSDWNPEIHVAWGAMLGQMHRATEEYRPSAGIRPRYRWDEEPRYVDALDVLPLDDPLRDEFQRCWEWLEGLPEPPGAFGLIHSDVHRGNFFVLPDGGLKVIDFDDCLYSWFTMDLAMPLFYSKGHRGRDDWGRPQLEELLASLLMGYEQHHRLDPIWVERVWGFLRWRRVQLHVTGHVWASQGDPSVLEARWFHHNQGPLELGRLELV